MSAVQKRLFVVALTAVLILLASASLCGQVTLSPGERFAFYIASNGHMHALFAPNGGSWGDVDLTGQNSFCPAAAVGSSVTSLVDNVGYVHAYYMTTTNQICEFGINGISTSLGYAGYVTMPTTVAGAPAPASGSALTAFVDPASGSEDFVHVFYQGTNGQVYEFYYDGSGAGGTVYTFDDPTSLGGGPVAASHAAVTSFIDGGVMHIFYLGTNNNVYELYWTGGTSWHSDDPTSLAGAPVATSGSALTSFVDGSGVMHVFYLNSQDVHELYWSSAWHTDNVNAEAGAPVTALGSGLTGFVNASGLGDTGMHVMFLGTNEFVYALHSTTSPAWGYFDATAASGGVGAVSGSKLTSFRDTESGGVRLYFVGTNSHVYELYWSSEGTASETDVTVASGSSATAISGSALAGAMEPN